MGIEEIRQQKGAVLLELQEAEDRVVDTAHAARRLACSIDEFAKLIRPDDVPGKTGAAAVKGPNIAALRNEDFRAALDYENAIEVAERLRDATVRLTEARAKGRELGLR